MFMIQEYIFTFSLLKIIMIAEYFFSNELQLTLLPYVKHLVQAIFLNNFNA